MSAATTSQVLSASNKIRLPAPLKSHSGTLYIEFVQIRISPKCLAIDDMESVTVAQIEKELSFSIISILRERYEWSLCLGYLFLCCVTSGSLSKLSA